MSNLFTEIINFTLVALYFAIIASIVLLFASHLICSLDKSKSAYYRKKYQKQIDFLMTGNYQKLLTYAKEKGLINRLIKKEQLVRLIASYQLAY